LSSEVIQEVESALNDVKKAISNNDENLKDRVEKLKTASMKIGQYMHQNTSAQQSKPNAENAENADSKSQESQEGNEEQKEKK